APTVLWACSPQRHMTPQTPPKHTQAPTVLWACSPQRHMTPQTPPKHTQAPTVLWACSPQRHMTPQTVRQHARNIAVTTEQPPPCIPFFSSLGGCGKAGGQYINPAFAPTVVSLFP
ncbi:MAG: hypothetical protein ACOX9E_16215, partial [Lentisphaeria bacterium]